MTKRSKKPRPRKMKIKVPSPRRKFRVVFTVAVDVEMTESLITEAMSVDFASYVFPLTSAADVARHIAYNLVCNRAELRQLDGFALRKPKEAVISRESWDDGEAEELQPEFGEKL